MYSEEWKRLVMALARGDESARLPLSDCFEEEGAPYAAAVLREDSFPPGQLAIDAAGLLWWSCNSGGGAQNICLAVWPGWRGLGWESMARWPEDQRLRLLRSLGQ